MHSSTRAPNLIWPEELDPGPNVHIPHSWESVALREASGTIMILGASDSGKSTFAKYLLSEFRNHEHGVGYLDCDVGQSTLGLPTTLNLGALSSRCGQWEAATYFVGHISPRGHMLPLAVGAHRLQRRAQTLGIHTIIVDTTGLVAPNAGGVALKHSLIELLEPTTIVGLRTGTELVPILRPWKHCQRLQVFELLSIPQVVPKRHADRVHHRHRRWHRYFGRAGALVLSLRQFPRIAVFGLQRASRGQLLALRDEEGLVIGLGIIQGYDRRARELVLHTPVSDLEPVCSLQVGALRFHLEGGEVREWAHRAEPPLVQ